MGKWLALFTIAAAACGARSAPRFVPDGGFEGEAEAEAEAESEAEAEGFEAESEGEAEAEGACEGDEKECACREALAHFCDCCEGDPTCGGMLDMFVGFCLDEPMCAGFCLSPGADMTPCPALEDFCFGPGEGEGEPDPECVDACVPAIEHAEECCDWGLSEGEILEVAMDCCAFDDCDVDGCTDFLTASCDEILDETDVCDQI